MRANVAFSLGAAAVALLISGASAVKGRWAVAIVFGVLVAGFLLRALEGRRPRSHAPPEAAPDERLEVPPPAGPAHAERRVKPASFKRR